MKLSAVFMSAALLVTSLVSLEPVRAVTGNEAANAAESSVNWSPLVFRNSVIPQTFQGSDNKYNLVYELIVDSCWKHPVLLEGVEILNADNNSVVKTLSNADLKSVLVAYEKTSQSVLKPGSKAILYVNLEFEKVSDVPAKLSHRFRFQTKNLTNQTATFISEGSPITVNKQNPLVISPPLRGGKWIAVGGYCGTVGHRRTLYGIDNKMTSAQRYAIDWIRLDDNNFTTRGDRLANSSSAAYGQPVYAVADATVYGIKQGFGEQTPFVVKGEERFAFPGGNSITLDLGNGLYGFYAHLKPGSIKVKSGEKVARGQVLGELGNSGNSTGPHLHFHVTDDPHVLGSNGVPYVFDEFTMVGEVPNLGIMFKNDSAGRVQSIGASRFSGPHKAQLVREGHIVSFDSPKATN